jgi:hypothetical protein
MNTLIVQRCKVCNVGTRNLLRGMCPRCEERDYHGRDMMCRKGHWGCVKH